MTLSFISKRGSLQLIKDGFHLLELKYKNWLFGKASTEFNGNHIELKPKGIWHRKFDIYKNQIDKGDIIFNWNGEVTIEFTDDFGEVKSCSLKSKGFWKYRFELTDEENDLILVITPKMNWQRLNYDYEIEIFDHYMTENQLIELLTYCGFGTKLYLQMMSGSA